MSQKFLCNEGTQYLITKVKNITNNKVDKVSGKGLSTNDFTDSYKSTIDGLVSTGGQANVIETVKVNGTALPVTDKAVNVDLSGYALKTDIASVYRVKGSITYSSLIALTTAEVGDVYNVTDKNGANYVCITAKTAGASAWDELGATIDLSGYVQKESGKGLSTNDYTTEEKTKLAGIEKNANNYTHPTDDGNKHVPANGTSNGGKFLKATSTAGTYEWANVTMETIGLVAITTAEIDAMFE